MGTSETGDRIDKTSFDLSPNSPPDVGSDAASNVLRYTGSDELVIGHLCKDRERNCTD